LNKKISFLFIFTVLCCLILVLPVTGINEGKIAFTSYRNGGNNAEIYVINADGTDETRLTNNPSIDYQPTWSPDGSKIAFSSNRDGNTEIYVMNADGTGQTRLTYDSSHDYYPAWSPDGSKIVFSHFVNDYSYEIYVMNADGTGQTRLTNNPSIDYQPTWSPDGSKIAFSSNRDGDTEIYVMNADGTGQTRLTDTVSENHGGECPTWSPNGSKIAFSSYFDGMSEIYVMNADGTGQTRLTNNPSSDYQPTWSPDGSKIAFSSNRLGITLIYVMNADGTGQTPLTYDSSREPTWSLGSITTAPDIWFDRLEYTDLTQNATIFLKDDSLNINPEVQDTADIYLISDHYEGESTSSDKIHLFKLYETGLDSSLFSGSYPFSTIFTTINNGMIYISPDYPGRLRIQYPTGSLQNSSNYKFCYDVTASTYGSFVQGTANEAHLPLDIVVTKAGIPISGTSVVIESKTGELLDELGETDASGELLVNLSMNDEIDNKIAGESVKIVGITYNPTTEPYILRGAAIPKILYEKTEMIPPIIKQLNGDDVDKFLNRQVFFYFTASQQISFENFFISLLGLIGRAGNLLSVTFNLLSFMNYYAHEVSYIPTIGDTHSIYTYQYTADGVDPAYQFIYRFYSINQQREYVNRIWIRTDAPVFQQASVSDVAKVMYLYVLSPAVLYVTAPDGSHAGYNPVTMQLEEEFPIFISNPGDEPFYVIIPNPMPGEYLVQVVGTGEGDYELKTQIVDENSLEILEEHSFNGSIKQGETVQYKIELTGLFESVQIYPGWNFISIPKYLSEGNNTAQIISSIDTTGRPIFSYNAENCQWNLVENTTILEPLEAYWVYSNEFTGIPLDYRTDPVTPPVKHLYPGWNTIGLGSLYPMTADQALAPIHNKWTVVLQFDNGLQIYRPPIVTGDTETAFNPGEGYWIYMKEEGEIVGFG